MANEEEKKPPMKVSMGGTENADDTTSSEEVVEDVIEAVEEDVIEEEEESYRIEDQEDDAVLFEDGPTFGEIKAWKVQFGKVYVTAFSLDTNIVWRALGRAEYKQIVREMEALAADPMLSQAEANFLNEERIVHQCILFPNFEDISNDESYAGLIPVISQNVMEASGFVALDVREL